MQNPAGQPAGFLFGRPGDSVVGEELRPEIADAEIREVVGRVLVRVILGFLLGREAAVAEPCAVAEGQGALLTREVLVSLRDLPAIAPMARGFTHGGASGLFPLDGFRAGGQVWMSHSARPFEGVEWLPELDSNQRPFD